MEMCGLNFPKISQCQKVYILRNINEQSPRNAKRDTRWATANQDVIYVATNLTWICLKTTPSFSATICGKPECADVAASGDREVADNTPTSPSVQQLGWS